MVYVSVRGWVQSDSKQLEAIQAIIASSDNEYPKAWVTAGDVGSWTKYTFFGADIREDYLEPLLRQVELIAAVPAIEQDEHVSGVFFVSSERGERSEWLIKNGVLTNVAGSASFTYLDI